MWTVSSAPRFLGHSNEQRISRMASGAHQSQVLIHFLCLAATGCCDTLPPFRPSLPRPPPLPPRAVADCCNAARHLAASGAVDGARLCITGGSAGGYTTLAAVAFRWSAWRAAGGQLAGSWEGPTWQQGATPRWRLCRHVCCARVGSALRTGSWWAAGRVSSGWRGVQWVRGPPPMCTLPLLLQGCVQCGCLPLWRGGCRAAGPAHPQIREQVGGQQGRVALANAPHGSCPCAPPPSALRSLLPTRRSDPGSSRSPPASLQVPGPADQPPQLPCRYLDLLIGPPASLQVPGPADRPPSFPAGTWTC